MKKAIEKDVGAVLLTLNAARTDLQTCLEAGTKDWVFDHTWSSLLSLILFWQDAESLEKAAAEGTRAIEKCDQIFIALGKKKPKESKEWSR